MEMSAGCILMIDADVIKALSGCIKTTPGKSACIILLVLCCPMAHIM
jgi:hypothetical protein